MRDDFFKRSSCLVWTFTIVSLKCILPLVLPFFNPPLYYSQSDLTCTSDHFMPLFRIFFIAFPSVCKVKSKLMVSPYPPLQTSLLVLPGMHSALHMICAN